MQTIFVTVSCAIANKRSLWELCIEQRVQWTTEQEDPTNRQRVVVYLSAPNSESAQAISKWAIDGGAAFLIAHDRHRTQLVSETRFLGAPGSGL